MPDHPLAEVFGFPADNHSPQAQRYRAKRLCPYNNRVANCTKDKANDPLGVCSIFDQSGAVTITCPVRFRQEWLILDDAAAFFFPPGVKWTSLAEVRLTDANDKQAGNIDVVLVAYDDLGQLVDFGAVEVQAVYISGNIRRPFAHYMQNPKRRANMDWTKERHYPRPDYLSSSRKRLVPQLLYKGGILNAWGKKQAVVLNRGFFETLPTLDPVSPQAADMAWLVYDLVLEPGANVYRLQHVETVYTQFGPALNRIATTTPGSLDDFTAALQTRLDEKLENDDNPPDAPSLTDLF